MKKQFLLGRKDGIPIAPGYLSVVFGSGILSASLGITPLEAWSISASNLTSAGQMALAAAALSVGFML